MYTYTNIIYVDDILNEHISISDSQTKGFRSASTQVWDVDSGALRAEMKYKHLEFQPQNPVKGGEQRENRGCH